MIDKDLEFQSLLKIYLDRFYYAIFIVRLGIEVHKTISDAIKKNKSLSHGNWWGYIQGHENLRTIVLTMFAIFDNRTSSVFKKFCRFLIKYGINNLTLKHLATWREILKPHEIFRHEKIAHLSINNPYIPPVNYEIFLILLTEFEQILRKIHDKYITNPQIKSKPWNCSEPDTRSDPMLLELRNLLSL